MNQKKTVIFGAGQTGRRLYHILKKDRDIRFFVDNDQMKWHTEYENIPIFSPEQLKERNDYDEIVLATFVAGDDIENQLKCYEIPLWKLNQSYVQNCHTARLMFLKRFAELAHSMNIPGAVAEAGVFRGDFAKEINREFQDRTCHLFDTFTGFDPRDFDAENGLVATLTTQSFHISSEELVLGKMPFPEMVQVHKGYFPETVTQKVLDDSFAFVNLDMDLYNPTLAGLRIFWPRLSANGVILIHDYFPDAYPNIKKAVKDFEAEIGHTIPKIPIGDDISIALIK